MVKKGIILADFQFPQHNQTLLFNVMRYMREHRWDYLVMLGDFLDMDAISHHAFEHRDNRSLEGKRLKRDYADASKILRTLAEIAGKKCDKTFFVGNHEEWADKFISIYPQLEGFLEPENNLPLKELGFDLIPPRHAKKIGKITFAHGDVSNGAMGYSTTYHSKKMLDLYNRNVVYGDKHTLQVFTKISPAGIQETHTAYAIPAMANISPSWAKDRPNSWLNGFATWEQSDTRFTIHPIVAVHNGFVIEGKEYQ